MDFFRKDIRFHGNTYQFTYDYKGIIRFFLLPMPDEVLNYIKFIDKRIICYRLGKSIQIGSDCI